MAKRFGGQYSPDGAQGAPRSALMDQVPARAGARVNFLFLAPFPLAIRAFFTDPLSMAFYLSAFGLLILAAWLTREGLKAEAAYEARKISRRPAIPRKIFGAVAMALGLALAGYASQGVIGAAVFAVLGLVLHLFAFGLDPLKDKGAEGIDMFQQDRVARAVGEAEKHLDAMKDAILRAGERELLERVERFERTARDMFRTVEEDPRDLTQARKYLVVYLQGARDATVKFADFFARTRDCDARDDYVAFLDDLEQNFAARTRKMLLDDRADLDVEIEVLRERLQREGVRPVADTD